MTPPAHAVDPIVLEATRRGHALEILASATLEVELPVAWRVLTDYERYVQFIPDLQTSRVLRRDGAELILEQRGEARFLWLRFPLAVRLAVTEEAPRRVESRLLDGTVREMVGRYELSPSASGARLIYTGRIVPEDERTGPIDAAIIRATVSRQFTALVREIERVGGARRRVED